MLEGWVIKGQIVASCGDLCSANERFILTFGIWNLNIVNIIGTVGLL